MIESQLSEPREHTRRSGKACLIPIHAWWLAFTTAWRRQAMHGRWAKPWERDLIFTTVVTVAVLVVFAALPLCTRGVHKHKWDDHASYFLPLRVFYANCLARGDAFDWMPDIFGGIFLSGEGQIGTYHPLHWLLYRWLPLDVAYDLELVWPFILMPLGCMLFLRQYLNLAGSWFGAALMTYSTAFTANMCHPLVIDTLTHVPWLLLLIQKTVTAGSGRARLLASLGVAWLTASEILLGHPQSEWFSALLEAGFALFLVVGTRARWTAWLALLAAKLFGAALAAVQLLATLEHLAASTRAAVTYEFKCIGALDPMELWGLIAPCLSFGRVPGCSGVYFGAVTVLLVLWWLTTFRAVHTEPSARGVSTGRLTAFALVAAAMTLWLALGDRGGLYYYVTLLPVIGNFRCPGRYGWLTGLCVMIVASCAFARLVTAVRNEQRLPWRHLVLPWLAVAAAIALGLWIGIQIPKPSDHTLQMRAYVGPILFGVAALGLSLASRGHHFGLFVLVVVGTVDLGMVSLAGPFVQRTWQPEHCLPFDQLATAFPNPIPPPARLYDKNDGNWHVLTGHQLVSGYAALFPVQQLDYDHVNSLRIASVEWYHTSDFNWGKPRTSPPGLGPVDDWGWCQVPDPLPRVRLVTSAVTSASPANEVKCINVDTEAVVGRAIELPASQPGVVTIVSDRPGKILIETNSPATQLLAISESYHAGWVATINQAAVPVERVNGDFLGCVVPSGINRVQLTFDPLSLRLGKAVSLTSAALSIILLGVYSLGSASPKEAKLQQQNSRP